MPRVFTLATLITRCKQRADRENDSHIADSEWQSLISEVYGSEVYGVIVDSGLPYFQYEATITATGAASYAEPTDHLASIGLEYVDGTRRLALVELMAQEIPGWTGATGSPARAWAHIDDRIFLYPNPSSGSYVFKYVGQPPDLSNVVTSTNVDVYNADGEAALIWGVTVLAKSKSEEDVTLCIRQREEAKTRLIAAVANRSMNHPRRFVVDDHATSPDYDPADWRWSR